MSKNLLLIFTRNPELGKVKTRLAKGIGDQNALEIYKMLLEHTRDVATEADCIKRVGYSVKVRDNDIWNTSIFEKFKQEGQDLGDRMYNAFHQAFVDGYTNVLIIGSDLYDLQIDHIHQAFTALENNDAVIGPAQDGGYYLLGMSILIKEVFYNKDWGNDSVYQDTIKDLSTKKIYTLETLNDIDVASDLKPYPIFKKYLD